MHARIHDRHALQAALGITAAFFVVEVVGGWWTNSLALLSDAVHMFTDVAALMLALFALSFATRSPTESKTYGYYRAEILGALLNGLALWLAVIWIAYEAFQRLSDPPTVRSGEMAIVAAIGLAANVACAWMLKPHDHGDSINLRAAYLHVLADMLGSIGALAAGAVMMITGWYRADALAAFFIAVLILVASWELIREAMDILMEGVPEHIDLEELRAGLEGVNGTERVHDLHVWTLTTGQYALSAHAVMDGSVDGEHILEEMRILLASRFQIDHVTIQLERTRPCEPETVHV